MRNQKGKSRKKLNYLTIVFWYFGFAQALIRFKEEFMSKDHRKHRRTLFNRDILLDSVDGKKTVIKANDISTSGMGLYADMPRLKGELLRLTFDLIQHGQRRKINIAGEVKHVQLAEYGYSFGVRFL